MSILDGHLDLFKLAWVSDPDLLKQQGSVTGVTDPYAQEMAAWCMELHTHFAELAEERGLPLLLMGGNAAALRVEVAKQRGSADNDYLTSASRDDIAALVKAFEDRFADIPTPFFKPELIDYRGGQPLPLMSYKVMVPELHGRNPAIDGQLMVKIEFHIEDDLPLPPSEELTAESGAVGEAVKAKMPLVPYQVGLKLMTLVEPPVGIDRDRAGAIPRQIYDLDTLFQQVLGVKDWQALHEYAEQRYAKEVGQRQLSLEVGEPWGSIDTRLGDWSGTERGGPQWKLIDGFQAAQVGRATQRTPDQWRARVQRIRVAGRCAAMGADGYALWEEVLRTEALLPERAQGDELKRGRRVLAPVADVALRAYPSLRSYYWDALGNGHDLRQGLAAVVEAVRRLSLRS